MFQSGKLINNMVPVAVLLLAFALRIVAIDQIPAGLSHDEAYNGITAIQVLKGERRIFFEINKGIEPLIIYLEALAFYAFGIGPVPLRLVNVFCGLLTVALIYPLTVRLFNRRIALLAMTGLAVSFWAIFVSRLTLRAVTLPPLLMLALYFYWRGLTEKPIQQPTDTFWRRLANLRYFSLSGLAAGVAMYTYLANRFIPLLLLAIFGYQLLRGQIRKQHWLGLFLHFAIWALLFAPLGNYYLENAESFTERYNQVATIPYALNGEFGPVIRNTLSTLGMFTFYGDETDRYNLDGRPVFDWINGLFFYLGVVLLLWRGRGSPHTAGPAAFLLLWFFSMLLPDFLTDDSPHFLRTIGAMPAVYLLWALGLAWVAGKLNRWVKEWGLINHGQQAATEQSSRRSALANAPSVLHISLFSVASFLIVLLILFTTLHTSYDYFIRWASAAEARYIYGADIAEVADHLKAKPDEGVVAISAEYYRDLDPFRLALHFQGHPPFVIWFDGQQTLAFPPPQSNLSPPYIFAASAPPAESWLPFLQPAPAESGQEYTLYYLPDRGELPLPAEMLSPLPDAPAGVNINNELILAGYEMLGSVASGGKFQVLLGWQALRTLPPGTDYTFLVRLRDQQGHIWAEADGNGYTPSDWQPGVQALQLLTLRLPGDLPSRTYQLTVEVVDRQQGRSLPTAGGNTVIPLTSVAAGHQTN